MQEFMSIMLEAALRDCISVTELKTVIDILNNLEISLMHDRSFTTEDGEILPHKADELMASCISAMSAGLDNIVEKRESYVTDLHNEVAVLNVELAKIKEKIDRLSR